MTMSVSRAVIATRRILLADGSITRTPFVFLRTTVPTVAYLAKPFSSSLANLKKRKPDATSSDSPQQTGPLDLAPIEKAFAEVDTHFQQKLQKLLHGGSFNPDQLGTLPVAVKPPGNGGVATSFPLRELAQIVPRSGRTISLLLNDKAYVKPIMSAVQSSPDLNQQPQRVENNELELLLRVEMERPEELVRRIKEAVQDWRDRVRQARTKHDKMLKDAKKKGSLLPDAMRKVEKELQKLQDKKMKQIDNEEAQSVKQVGRKI